MRRFTSLAVALSLLLVVGGCSHVPRPAATQPPGGTGVLRIHAASGWASLQVEIADADPARELGLMNRRDLAPDAGMAFEFAEPTQARFWMKDTLIPLSIAFVDQDGRVVTIEDMEPCHADPCPTYAAASPYTIAVEANRGWFARAGVAVGDRAALEPMSP
jgi:uncharacterized membrane protein (UPF0127 family)